MHEDEPSTESIRADDQASTVGPADAGVGELQPGDRVGYFVIRERLGEGGFAVVYLAEQEKPVRRRVALKTPGLASPASLSCPDDRSRSCQFVR